MSDDKDAALPAGTYPPSQLIWVGRSGRRYTLSRVDGEGYVMAPDLVYGLLEDRVVTWAGTAQDLISDQSSRARFRRAATGDARLFWLPAPDDELALMTLVWDLDGTRQGTDRNAA